MISCDILNQQLGNSCGQPSAVWCDDMITEKWGKTFKVKSEKKEERINNKKSFKKGKCGAMTKKVKSATGEKRRGKLSSKLENMSKQSKLSTEEKK